LLPPPHPIAPTAIESTSALNIVSHARRRRGTPIISASAVPAEGHSSLFNWFLALVDAVVEIVNVDVCAPVPVIVTEAGERVHAAGSLAATGLIEHVRLTVPVNPFDGVIVMGTVLPVVAPDAMLIDALPPPIKNDGAGFTVTEPLT